MEVHGCRGAGADSCEDRAVVPGQRAVTYWLPFNSSGKTLPTAVLYLHVKPLWTSNLSLF